ncbi:MAG: hypothetical protein WBG35_14155, partial [Acidobacteriaceae bacterium]
MPAFNLSTIRKHTPSSSFGFSLRLAALLAALLLAYFSPFCQAQYGGARNPSMGSVSGGLPTYLKHAGIAQNLNRKLPLSAAYVD